MQQHKAGIGAYHRLEHDAVGKQEGVFGSRHLLPRGNGLPPAGGETIESVAMFLRIVIGRGDDVEHPVIGLLQIGRKQEEHIGGVLHDLAGEVLAVGCLHTEVGVGRFCTALCSLHTCVDVGPRAVWIVFGGKLTSLTVFLHDEVGLGLPLCRVPLCQLLPQVHPYAVGQEVDRRQSVEAHSRKDKREGPGAERHCPLVALGDETCHEARLAHQQNGGCEQHHILPERLPVGEHQRVTEAAAVPHRIGDGQIERERSEGKHEGQCQDAGAAAAYAEQQIDAHRELQHGQNH